MAEKGNPPLPDSHSTPTTGPPLRGPYDFMELDDIDLFTVAGNQGVNLLLDPELQQRPQGVDLLLNPEIQQLPTATETPAVQSCPQLPLQKHVEEEESLSGASCCRSPISSASTGSPVCPVCLRNQAGNLSAFGGRSCASCRAFFRRAVQAGRTHTFICRKGGCVINSQSWRSCSKCRFTRCMDEAGMRQNLVKGVHKMVKPVHTTVSLIRSPKNLLTVEDRSGLVAMYDLTRTFLIKRVLHSQMVEAATCVEVAMSGSARKWDAVVRISRAMDDAIFSWPAQELLKDLTDLPKEDQATLLQKNFPLVQIIFGASVFDNKSLLEQFLVVMMQTPSLREQVLVMMKQEKMSGEIGLPMLEYSQVYPEGEFRNEEEYSRHRSLTMTLGQWTFDDPFSRHRATDKIYTTLLFLIILFSSQGLDLAPNVTAQINAIQKKYYQMLTRYLGEVHKNSESTHQMKFQRVMHVPGMAKELHELSEITLKMKV